MSRGASNKAAGKQSWSCPLLIAAIWKKQCLKVVWMVQLFLWAMSVRGVLPWELGAVTLQNQRRTTSRSQAMDQCYQKLLLSISECEESLDKRKKKKKLLLQGWQRPALDVYIFLLWLQRKHLHSESTLEWVHLSAPWKIPVCWVL